MARYKKILSACLFPLAVLAGAGKSLEESSAERAALIFLLIAFLSFLIEGIFHNLEKWMKKTHRYGILGAIHKMKEELMLLGFVSLILIAFEDNILKICVPEGTESVGIPCCNTWASNKSKIESVLSTCLADAQGNFLKEKKCNKTAISDWRAGGGFVPGKGSSLVDICRAPGQAKQKLVSEQHEYECPALPDGTPTAPFMDGKALHEVHTLIFLTAVCHILYSSAAMLLSQRVVRRWTHWENFGTHPADSLENLRLPKRYSNTCQRALAGSVQQFTTPVDALSYILLRRCYIIKNDLDPSFHFNNELLHKTGKDFKEMVGVDTWMFFIIVFIIMLDGFVHPAVPSAVKAVNSIVAIIATLVIGTKFNCVFTDMTEKIIDKLKEITPEKDFLQKPTICARDLHILQDRMVSDPTIFDNYKPDFWFMSWKCCICLRPNLNIIRLTMFQNSLMFAQTIFFAWQGRGAKSCYFTSRHYGLVIFQIVSATIMLFVNGLATVPMYSITSITAMRSKASKRFFKASRRINLESHLRNKALLAKLNQKKEEGSSSESEDNQIDLDFCRRILQSYETGKMDKKSVMTSLFNRMKGSRSTYPSGFAPQPKSKPVMSRNRKRSFLIGQQTSFNTEKKKRAKREAARRNAKKEWIKLHNTISAITKLRKAIRKKKTRSCCSFCCCCARKKTTPALPTKRRKELPKNLLSPTADHDSVSSKSLFLPDSPQSSLEMIVPAQSPPPVSGPTARLARKKDDLCVSWTTKETDHSSSKPEDDDSPPSSDENEEAVAPLMSFQEMDTHLNLNVETKRPPSILTSPQKNTTKRKKQRKCRDSFYKKLKALDMCIWKTYDSTGKHDRCPIIQGVSFLVIVILVCFFLATPMYWYGHGFGYYVPHWGYEGAIGPEFWYTLDKDYAYEVAKYIAIYVATYGREPIKFDTCSDGLKQSPIDIEAGLWNTSTQPSAYSHARDHIALGDVLSLKSSYYAPYFGHSLLRFYCHKGPYGGCGSIYWKGERGYDTFHTHYMEIHSPAEHTIDMVSFPMELQVYHCNGGCTEGSEYVVISVLFSVGNSSSSQEIEKLWGSGTTSFEDAQDFMQQKNKTKAKYKYMKHTKKKVDMSHLYDLNAGFFHYNGSFTTPPCVESVQFLVQSGPAKISREDLVAVKRLIGHPGNARPNQPLYKRKVKYFSRKSMSPSLPYRVQSTDYETSSSFKARPPEWARKEHCSKYEQESTTYQTAGENPFYDCSQMS